MIHPQANTCDEALLDRYLDGDLDAEEKAQMAAHLEGCRDCRRQVAAITAFSRGAFNSVFLRKVSCFTICPLW